MDERIRILFLAADPSNLTRTRLAAEYQVIRDELDRGRLAKRFLLEAVYSVQIRDMTRVVKNFRPHLIHFSGHGSIKGELCFEGPEEEAKGVKPEDLEGIFARSAGRVDCLVICTCYSETLAARISDHIPFVVGIKKLITDEAAICFARGFYQTLSAGGNLEEAFKDGCALLRAEGPHSVEPILKVGPRSEKPLAGPWEDRVDSTSAEPLSAMVKVRNSHSGRDTSIKAVGPIDAKGIQAGRDLTVRGTGIG